MPKTVIDIGKFREVMTGARPPKAAPAVRFTTTGDAVATSDSRTFTFVFSDETVDRYGDIILAHGWDLKNFNANPIALFCHDASSVDNIMGRAKNVRVEGSRLVGDIEFAGADANPKAEVVRRLVEGGFLKTVSVGFAPIEWAQAKDKSRPGGVDFTKSELLEISIVPIPANPNALVQAKAAGIDVDRLAPLESAPEAVLPVAERSAPPMTKKGLYSVSYLASILSDLGYLSDTVNYEAAYEEDGSPVPAALLDAIKALGQVLVDMTIEEVSELVGGDDDDDLGVVIGMSLKDSRLALARSIVKLSADKIVGLATVARDLAAGRVVHVKTAEKAAFAPLVRAGKAISAKNEKHLKAAHEHIMAVLEPPDDEDPETGSGENDPSDDASDDEEKAMRARKAAALKRKHSLAN